MKKFFIISILATGCILYSGCGSKQLPEQEKATQVTKDCKQGCDMISIDDEEKKTSCYQTCETSEKLESDDIADCENIEATSNNFITKDICIQDKAIQEKNSKYCEKIEDNVTKDGCYMGISQQTKNKDICKNIQNELMKQGCIDNE